MNHTSLGVVNKSVNITQETIPNPMLVNEKSTIAKSTHVNENETPSYGVTLSNLSALKKSAKEKLVKNIKHNKCSFFISIYPFIP